MIGTKGWTAVLKNVAKKGQVYNSCGAFQHEMSLNYVMYTANDGKDYNVEKTDHTMCSLIYFWM